MNCFTIWLDWDFNPTYPYQKKQKRLSHNEMAFSVSFD